VKKSGASDWFAEGIVCSGLFGNSMIFLIHKRKDYQNPDMLFLVDQEKIELQ
jgi:hypothetical protein